MFTEDTEEADEELSDDLMSAVTQSNQAIADISGRLENLETLLRLVCHVSFSFTINYFLVSWIVYVCIHVNSPRIDTQICMYMYLREVNFNNNALYICMNPENHRKWSCPPTRILLMKGQSSMIRVQCRTWGRDSNEVLPCDSPNLDLHHHNEVTRLLYRFFPEKFAYRHYDVNFWHPNIIYVSPRLVINELTLWSTKLWVY